MKRWKEIALMALCVLIAFGMLVAVVWMTGEMYGNTYGALHYDDTVAEMVNRGWG